MIVEVSTDPGFRRVRRVPGALLPTDADFTGKTVLPGLPDGADIFYRVAPGEKSKVAETLDEYRGQYNLTTPA